MTESRVKREKVRSDEFKIRFSTNSDFRRLKQYSFEGECVVPRRFVVKTPVQLGDGRFDYLCFGTIVLESNLVFDSTKIKNCVAGGMSVYGRVDLNEAEIDELILNVAYFDQGIDLGNSKIGLLDLGSVRLGENATIMSSQATIERLCLGSRTDLDEFFDRKITRV